MRHLYLSLIFTLGFSVSMFAQKSSIKGVVQDTSGNPLIAATVMLLDSDSTLVDFQQTNTKGAFEFKNISEKEPLVKITYLGYIPALIKIDGQNKTIDLGIIEMKEISQVLMEVVIKEAKAPIVLRGDTIEYDASKFKVPEGSTLEQLLRRLPGIDVTQDGIQSDGKNVSELTVDGKTFFSKDPKFAMKNLPAEGVSKVQVFDKKDEEALLTGKTSEGNQEKTMNIELKNEFKKGGFGKITAGGGTETRGELKGNYNKFDTKHQFSLIGVANNTGRNGLSWDDYEDYMGSSSWGNENDNLDYGFGGNGFRFMSFSSGGSSLENKISQAFWSDNSSGFPKSLLGGINYNYDHKKNKFSGRYFYQNTGNLKESISDSRSFLTDFYLDNSQLSEQDKGSRNHRIETMYQHDIDSLLTMVITAEAALVNTADLNAGESAILKNSITPTSSNTFRNSSDVFGNLINTSLLFRKRFKKAGRSVGLNGSILKTNVSDDQESFSNSSFYNDAGVVDSTQIIHHFNDDLLDKLVFKANAMYSEPISKTLFFKVFHNFNTRNENGHHIVQEQNESGQLSQNDSLSREYDNQITLNRSGASLTISKFNLNLSLGGGYQSLKLKGIYQSPDSTLFNGKVDRTFATWIPNIELNGSIWRNSWFHSSYSVNVSEPTIVNLLPVTDYSNPFYIKKGNPELMPEYYHSLSLFLNHSWPLNGIRLGLNGSYNYYKDQIISEQIVDENLITISKPLNHSGGDQIWSNFNVGFPIIRNKLTTRLNSGYNRSNSFAIVNSLLNHTISDSYSQNFNLDITPDDKLVIYLSAYLSLTDTRYDINTSQNQQIIRQNYRVEFTANFAKGWYFNSNFRYNIIKNERFGIDQQIPLLNASVYKQFLKGNKGELRLSVYDAFNKNIQYNQYTSVSKVSESQTLSLARYVMLSFSYNIRGMKSDVGRHNMWW